MSSALSLNQVILLGRVGSHSAATVGANQDRVFNFGVATTRSWFDQQGDKREATIWTNCVAWRALADVCERLITRGTTVLVVGELQTREFTNREGHKQKVSEVVAQRVFCLRDLVPFSDASEAGEPVPANGAPEDGDLPF